MGQSLPMPDNALTTQPGLAPALPGDEFLSVIAGAAADPRVDVSKMEALLQMKLTILRENAAAEFAAAMARLQPKLPRIAKAGTIDFKGIKQPYAKYEDILAGVRPLLAEEGFSVSYSFADGPKGTTCTCAITHRAGHSKTSTTPPLPMDTSGSKNAVQAVGSTMSYAKRYALCNALDIVTVDQDDDAATSDPLTDAQLGNVMDLVDMLHFTPERKAKFLKFAGAESYETIQQHAYQRVIEALRKLAEKAAPR